MVPSSDNTLEAIVAGIDDSHTSVQEMFEHGEADSNGFLLWLASSQRRYWINTVLDFHHDIAIMTLDSDPMDYLNPARAAKGDQEPGLCRSSAFGSSLHTLECRYSH